MPPAQRRAVWIAAIFLVLWLGPERGISIDSEWLALKLDEDSRVIEARILND